MFGPRGPLREWHVERGAGEPIAATLEDPARLAVSLPSSSHEEGVLEMVDVETGAITARHLRAPHAACFTRDGAQLVMAVRDVGLQRFDARLRPLTEPNPAHDPDAIMATSDGGLPVTTFDAPWAIDDDPEPSCAAPAPGLVCVDGQHHAHSVAAAHVARVVVGAATVLSVERVEAPAPTSVGAWQVVVRDLVTGQRLGAGFPVPRGVDVVALAAAAAGHAWAAILAPRTTLAGDPARATVLVHGTGAAEPAMVALDVGLPRTVQVDVDGGRVAMITGDGHAVVVVDTGPRRARLRRDRGDRPRVRTPGCCSRCRSASRRAGPWRGARWPP